LIQQTNNQTSLFFYNDHRVFLGGKRGKREGREKAQPELNCLSSSDTRLTTMTKAIMHLECLPGRRRSKFLQWYQPIFYLNYILYIIKKTQLPLTPYEINKKKKNQDKMIKVPLHPKPEKFNSQGHVSYYTIQKKSKN
jgi:hypothetical protein